MAHRICAKRVRCKYNYYLKSSSPLKHMPRSSLISLTNKIERTTNIALVDHDQEVILLNEDTNINIISRQRIEQNEPDITIQTHIDDNVPASYACARSPSSLDLDYINHLDQPSDMEMKTGADADMTDNAEKCSSKANELNLPSSMLLLMTFVVKHGLTGPAIIDLLELVRLHSSENLHIPKTLHEFKKYFSDLKHPLLYHKYCTHCKHLIGIDQHEVCPSCEAHLDKQKSLMYYIEVPIRQQIISLFSQRGFYEKLQYRFNRTKKNYDTIEDIYDGTIYQGIPMLKNPHNLSFTWNTDGIPIFKSSSASLWPFYLMINELPYSQRCQRENMVLAGVWFGHDKPDFLSYLKRLHSSLLDMEKNGVEVQTNHDEGTFLCKAVVICGTCDLPARASVCNMKYYSGSDSCIKCEEPGKNIPSGKGRVQVFVHTPPNILGQARTEESIRQQAQQAHNSNTIVHGIKGPSYLSCLSFYKFVDGMGLDYMHGILYGVSRKLADLWLSSEHTDELFSISTSASLIDERLLNVQPPNNISRLPRSIKHCRNYWKATEWKNWLLYYSMAILKDILLEEYFEHYKLLVEACFIFLNDSILPDHLKAAERYIFKFVIMFPDLYHERFATLNIHQLLHLPDCVRCLGPMWCYSCFPFEDANGKLLKLFHGTQHIDQQVANAISVDQKLPEIANNALPDGSKSKDFYLRMKGLLHFKKLPVKHLEGDYYALGAVSVAKLTHLKLKGFEDFFGYRPIKSLQFARLRVKSEIFTSRSYTRAKLRNSYTIMFQDNNAILEFGTIDCFLQVWLPCRNISCRPICICPAVHVAVVSILDDAVQSLYQDSMSRCTFLLKKNQKLKVVPIQNIIRKCVFVELKDLEQCYVSLFPNTIEKE